MSVSTPSDSGTQQEGLSEPASSDMSFDPNYPMPNGRSALPPQAPEDSSEVATPEDAQPMLGDEHAEWLKTEEGVAWARDQGFLTQEDRAKLQQSLSSQVNAAEARYLQAREENQDHLARIKGMIQAFDAFTKENNIDWDPNKLGAEAVNYVNSEKLNRQNANQQTMVATQQEIAGATQSFWNQFQAINESSDNALNPQDPELMQHLGTYQQGLALQKQSAMIGNQQGETQGYAQATDAWKKLIGRITSMQREAFTGNPGETPPEPQQPAQPSPTRQARLPQRSAAGGGGGSSLPSYTDILQNLVAEAGGPEKISRSQYDQLSEQAFITDQKNRYG